MSDKPAKKTTPRAKEAFGDPGLSSAHIDPIPASLRARGFAQVAAPYFGLVLMPSSLALLAVLRPLVDSGKGALVALIVGIACAALVTALAGAALARYGLLPGVWLRPMLGPLGAKIFTLLRLIVIATFFGHAAWLAAQTLLWGALCAWPQLVPFEARVPRMAGESLLLIALTLGLFAAVIAKPILRWAFVPALALVVSLAFVPGAGSVHALVSGAPAEFLLEPWELAFMCGVCLFATLLPIAREVRSPSAQSGAIALTTLVPWVGGALIYALATFRGSPFSRFSDLSELACARLPVAWLIPHTVLAAAAFLFPLSWPSVLAVRTGVYELLPRLPALAAQWVERGFLALGVVLALIARSDHGNAFLMAQLLLAALAASVVVVATADFYLVRRGHLFLDDLYSATGVYRGVYGLSPAGWVALTWGGAALFTLKARGAAGATAFVISLATWLAAQLVLGNLERWIRERK